MSIRPHDQRPASYWRQGITPSDVELAEDLTDRSGRDINRVAFHFNNSTGEWEVMVLPPGLSPTFRRPIADVSWVNV